jgi:misacylated tRNA(Ala) deacylase
MTATHKLFLDNSYQTEFEAHVLSADETGVRLDKTLFYATSGGQPGDTGRFVLQSSNTNIPIIGARKGDEGDDIIHLIEEGAPLPQPGEKVIGQIDWESRHKHMRMHTCLHLMLSLIEGYATGNQISADKSRIDFDVPTGVYDKETLTAQLNALIQADHPVSSEWIDEAILTSNPELVRTMSVQPPKGAGKIRMVRIGTPDNTIDWQPCGGTHVKSTGEIGPVAVTKIENKGKQNRRYHIAFA